jgi:hypothetical protein
VLIFKNPIYYIYQIHDVITQVIRELWPHVYKEINHALTPNTTSSDLWYDLTDATYELCSVSQVYGTNSDQLFFYGTRRGGYPASLQKNVPSGIASTGTGLYIPLLKHATNTINVNSIGALLGTFSTPNYTELTDGVQVDCVMSYTISKLLAISEVSRVTQEDITMADEALRPGVRTQISQEWERKAYEARRRWEKELEVTLPRRFSRAGDGGL